MGTTNEIEAKIKQHPSNFDLSNDVEQLPKECLVKVRNKLNHECEETPFDTKMEKLRAWNLISFLHFILGDEKLAFQYNSKVLDECSDNLVGLCNKAWFLIKTQEFYQVETMFDTLKEKSECKVNALVAKAEKAFCYSRFGMKLYEKSRQLFKEVLEECENIQALYKNAVNAPKLKIIPLDNICIWTFGYALYFKRTLNIGNIHDTSSLDVSRQRYVTVCDLHTRIIKLDGDGLSLNRYKARSYVEVGLLAYEISKSKDRFPQGIEDILPEHRDLWMPMTDMYFTEALKLCPDDVFVLERSGKYFRYTNEITKSVECLEKAVAMRESAYSHHHLALSLKRQLEQVKNFNHAKRNASRNLFSSYRKTGGGSVENRTTQRREIAAERKVFASAECTKVIQSSARFDLTSLDSDKDKTAKKSIEKVRHSEATSSSPLDTSELSDSLQQLSLDSAYGSMQLDSNDTQQQRLTEFRSMHQEGISSHRNYRKGLQNESQYKRSWRGKNDKGSQFERRSSKSTGTYENNTEIHSSRHGNRNPKPESKRGQPRTGYYASTRSHSATSKNQSSVVRMVKSPQKPKFIDKDANKTTFDKMIFHLDKSIKMTNCWALYDKGILYRQINEPKEALEIFKTLMRNKGGYCSIMQLSNAYEQAGLCLYDVLCESQGESEESKRFEHDMRVYFKKSIEISCRLVSKISFLKECWSSAPTLYSFLSGKAKTKENLKDLSYLFKKLENYGKAITVLNELKNLAENDAEKAEINLELVENYTSTGNYDDAVLALDMIMCLPDGYTLIGEHLYLTVHIDGGFDALKKEDYEMARLRVGNALDFSRCGEDSGEMRHDEDETDLEQTSYDVFILCNEELEDSVAHLMISLREFGLRVTFNHHDIMPGAVKMSGMCALMKHSKHLVVVCDVKPLTKKVEHNFEMMREIVFEKGHGHTVVLTTTPDMKVPTLLSKYPRINMELNIDTNTDMKCYENETFVTSTRELLFKLASGK